MAVTVSAVRNSHSYTNSANITFLTLTLSGAYATGGFTFNPFQAPSNNPGASPLGGTNVFFMDFQAPSGYIYRQSTVQGVTTVKIFSAPGTELANGTAVPDAMVPVMMVASRI